MLAFRLSPFGSGTPLALNALCFSIEIIGRLTKHLAILGVRGQVSQVATVLGVPAQFGGARHYAASGMMLKGVVERMRVNDRNTFVLSDMQRMTTTPSSRLRCTTRLTSLKLSNRLSCQWCQTQ